MPIIAFMGVPESKATLKNFRIMKECGFNVSLSQYSSVKSLQESCKIAQKTGIKILGNCPELKSRTEKVAKILGTEEGFYGYYLGDEPTAPEISKIGDQINCIKNIDQKHICYFNLLPYENPDWIEGNTKVKTYGEYLRIASQTSTQQISFDHYPIKNDGMCNTWFQNLEMIRKESLKSKKPFWGFVMSVPHWHYPQPTLGALRLQVYANLAYGAQAIQYFTYWTPQAKTENYNYHNGPVSNDGNITNTYSLVQSVNKELKQISELFHGAQVTSVNHFGKISLGTTKLKKIPKNIKSLKIVSKKGTIVSQLRKNSHLYLVIVNKDYINRITVLIKTATKVRRVLKSLREETVKESYTLEPGDILLFKLD